MSKKLMTAGLAVLMVMGIIGMAEAASTDTCLVKVSCNIDLSVSISTPAAGVDFGALDPDVNIVSASISTATNNSSKNTIETYRVKIEEVGTHNWDIVQSDDPSYDEVTFGLVFRSTTSAAPDETDFDLDEDYLKDTYDWCTASNYAVEETDGADEKGLNINPLVEARRRMWFLVRMPKNTSSQDVFTGRVYISANLPQ